MNQQRGNTWSFFQSKGNYVVDSATGFCRRMNDVVDGSVAWGGRMNYVAVALPPGAEG